jgi:hypothetical protein
LTNTKKYANIKADDRKLKTKTNKCSQEYKRSPKTNSCHHKTNKKTKNMHNKSFTALFAVIMLLLLVPFAPAYIEEQFSRAETIVSVPTAAAATTITAGQQIRDYTARGYAGEYSYTNSAVPDSLLAVQ